MNPLNLSGPLYQHLVTLGNWDCETRAAAEMAVHQLLNLPTTTQCPGMLLGKIQSGKTRTFLGIIALAFDNEFDLAVILTKGTRALAKQTLKRVRSDFADPIADHELRAFDVMEIPQDLTPSELRSKLILVVKKEDDNIRRLGSFLRNEYPELAQKRILVVDDEADFASIGFRGSRQNAKPAVLMSLIDNLRGSIQRLSFLQVTATPYSLYLQPDGATLNANGIVMPTRPAFTVLVPVHDAYVGGDVYFEESQDAGSVASYLFEPVSDEELLALKKQDARRLKLQDVLTSSRCMALRMAIVGFLMGASMARLRDEACGQRKKNYSFVIHTDQTKNSHGWQEEVVRAILANLRRAEELRLSEFETLMKQAYTNFSQSLQADGWQPISFEHALAEVKQNLDSISTQVVNSESQLESLLDDRGQLHLRNKLNIFIGGQILDRGLTIDHMIGFYYGRNPKSFQQDTVLQHSRMYGARDRRDLPVTRFYTSPRIYSVMNRIHEMDSALRAQIEKLGHQGGVVFVRRDGRDIVPCSPNRVKLTKITALGPGKRMLPVGFNVLPKSRLKKETDDIDRILNGLVDPSADRITVDVPVDIAVEILNRIAKCLFWEPSDQAYEWDLRAFLSAIEYTARGTGQATIFVRRGSKLSRLREGGRFQNAPETGAREIELKAARDRAVDQPLLVLLRHDGDADGWTGSPFWWPILYAPTGMKPVLYAADAEEESGA
jgi:hypothetical protein